jgi:sec-independent protein translocase protein TatA
MFPGTKNVFGGSTMNIFGIGLPEMALILVLALLVFGPKKLPEIGRSLGKAIRGFQEASKEFETEFKREAEQLERVIKEPMEAKLEEPPQPALSAAAEPAATEPSTTSSPEPAAVTEVAVLETATAVETPVADRATVASSEEANG